MDTSSESFVCNLVMLKLFYGGCHTPSKVCLVSNFVCGFHGQDIKIPQRLDRCPYGGSYKKYLGFLRRVITLSLHDRVRITTIQESPVVKLLIL